MSKLNKVDFQSTTAVSLLNTSSPKTGLEMLQTELKALQAIETTPWKTSGNFKGFGCNLKEQTDNNRIMDLAGWAISQAHWRNIAAEALGLKTYKSWTSEDGATKEDILADCNLKLAINSTESRRKLLESLVKDGQNLLSEQDKVAIWAEKVAAATNQ